MRNRGSRQNLEGGSHENNACPAGAEADPSTATDATAVDRRLQATLITAQESGQPVMDQLAFIASWVGASSLGRSSARRSKA